ncbi:MAG: protein kinase, partial [Myxococcales bacterium]|nr:protein kinase [Myxococcales bacterium]
MAEPISEHDPTIPGFAAEGLAHQTLEHDLVRQQLEDALFGANTALAPAESPKIGRFPLVRKLGAGGMGSVYVARDERLGRQVAIKLLRSTNKPTAMARLEREAQAMAKLSHPNVVQIYEIGDL